MCGPNDYDVNLPLLSLHLISPPLALSPSLSSLPPSSFSPSSHSPQSEVFVHVNRLDSVTTIIPYEYSKFDFCPLPDDSPDRDPSENLGQVLFGERLRASAYQVSHTHLCIVPTYIHIQEHPLLQ